MINKKITIGSTVLDVKCKSQDTELLEEYSDLINDKLEAIKQEYRPYGVSENELLCLLLLNTYYHSDEEIRSTLESDSSSTEFPSTEYNKIQKSISSANDIANRVIFKLNNFNYNNND